MCEVGFPSVLLLSPGPVALSQELRHPALATDSRLVKPTQRQRPCITSTMSHEQNGAPVPTTEAGFAEVGELLHL